MPAALGMGSDPDYSSPGRRILSPDHKDKKPRLSRSWQEPAEAQWPSQS